MTAEIVRLDDYRRGWECARVLCLVCGAEHASVHPLGTDTRCLECPECGHLWTLAEVVQHDG